ncbi:hypothetical protein NUU61_001499 [Penicillium alfredii]|uniref:Uncharacterized protein n=1 Tax=Penicillium alfredii TaxID=1506179 RepID=A0A9W9KM51_9EURO|nr:uncharacterized protein NUU61_001499 [Penicillium alfredii]KAJ5111869.1 hypothetical protein NUU61_001499 [Penicillium alfredii]
MDEQPDDDGWFNIQLNPADISQPNSEQDSLENQLSQFINDVTTMNDVGNTSEPESEKGESESPDRRGVVVLKYKSQRAVRIRSSPPTLTTDAPTVEDPNDEIWHETSERSDDD